MAGVFTKNMTNVMNVLLQDWYAGVSSINFSFTDWQGDIVTRQSGASTMRTSYEMLAQSFNQMGMITVPTSSGSGNTGFTFLAFGNGTAEPTDDDYMVTSLISTLTLSSVTCGKTVNGKQYTAVVMNGTADSIDISEFALFTRVNVDGSGSETLKTSIMLYHEVLEAPITLEPGQTATFTAELTFV